MLNKNIHRESSDDNGNIRSRKFRILLEITLVFYTKEKGMRYKADNMKKKTHSEGNMWSSDCIIDKKNNKSLV